jgi:AcrR family transcriptional regulator
MSHANAYRFFASREALIDAVLHTWLTQLESRLSEIVDGPDPADDKLERFLATLIRAYGETARSDPAVFDLLAVPPSEGQEAARHRRRVSEFLGRIVEEGMATRLFGGGEARRSVQLVLDLTHRFVDPAAVRLDLAEPPIPDLRRDRVVRAAIRALTVQR